jgi:uncharacterized protein involved in exopolysaccharide biosynthesis
MLKPAETSQSPITIINADGEIHIVEVMRLLVSKARLVIGGSLLAGVVAVGLSFLITPTFTAATVILPPAQSSSSTGLAMLAGQLGGALGGLAGAAASIKNPADQYVSMLKSRNVADRLIERFNLKSAYDRELMVETRDELTERTRIVAGMKDGLITIEVDDNDPTRAAAIANAYSDELRRLTMDFAIGEASQRRAFFEAQLKQVREALTVAERDLGTSGITDEALKAAPDAAITGMARLHAKITAQEVTIQSLSGFVTEDHPDLRVARAELAALKSQETRMHGPTTPDGPSSGYMSKYREFKYNLALFEIIAQQYELARLDEARESKSIQVIDIATAPERKSRPKRGLIGVVVTILTSICIAGVVVFSHLRVGDVPVSRS